MNKFWAIIDLCENETAQNILSALFSKEDFNSQNAILIEDQMVFVEVFFEGIPPQNIVEAIGSYSSIRCGYGEVSKEALKRGGKLTEQIYYPDEQTDKSDEDGAESKSERSEGDESTEPQESERSEWNETPTQQESVGNETDKTPKHHKKEKTKRTPKPQKTRKSREVPDKIDAVDEIAYKATSFENFVEEVSNWLGFAKWGVFFKNLVETATALEEISWRTLKEKMSFQLDTEFSYAQQKVTLCVSKKFSEIKQDVSILVLIKYMVKYKEFDFHPNIENKVKDILNEMGLEKVSSETKKIVLDVANTAVRHEHHTMIELCVVAGHGANEEEACDTRMIFSDFINEFFENNNMEMMTAEVFIKKLREAIYTGARIW